MGRVFLACKISGKGKILVKSENDEMFVFPARRGNFEGNFFPTKNFFIFFKLNFGKEAQKETRDFCRRPNSTTTIRNFWKEEFLKFWRMIRFL